MSRILINALSAQLGGGQTHLINIFNDRLDIWNDEELIFLTSESNTIIFEKYFGNEKIYNIGKVGNNFFTRTIWENLYLSRIANKKKIDVVFLAAGLAPFWMTKNCKWVAISHNLLPFSWKSIINTRKIGLSLKLIIIRYAQIWSFKHCHGVVFISNYAKKIISSFLSKEIIDTVIPSGVNQMFYEASPPIYTRPYILYVSTFFEYKHQKEVLVAFKKLKEDREIDIDLIFIGCNKGSYGEECKELCRKLDVVDCTKFMGNIEYDRLPAFMQNSLLNIFASDCENCPNILLEYLASRQPILCSKSEPMPEFGKSFVTYFDLSIKDDLFNKMKEMLENRKLITKENIDKVRAQHDWKLAASSLKIFLKKF